LQKQQFAQEAQVAAQLQLAAQIRVNDPLALPQPVPEIQHDLPPPLWDPLYAISPEDKILLDNCWKKLMGIAMESCSLCHYQSLVLTKESFLI
jgi:hypothetical protein